MDLILQVAKDGRSIEFYAHNMTAFRMTCGHCGALFEQHFQSWQVDGQEVCFSCLEQALGFTPGAMVYLVGDIAFSPGELPEELLTVEDTRLHLQDGPEAKAALLEVLGGGQWRPVFRGHAVNARRLLVDIFGCRVAIPAMVANG